MALVRDSDTSLWLHNKLGTSDSWSGPGSICSQLSSDVLRNTKECFIELQAQVKLKLLLSFLHIPRRNVDEWKVELEEILELATVDSDQWVSMLAELLKDYPSTGMINLDIEENTRVFSDLVSELRKLVKKTGDSGMIPMECLYLNKNALSTVVGQQPQPAKHFTLKRKPKSAALRAELLQKSSDAANNVRKNIVPCSVPIRSRSLAKRMDDTTPLKGLSSRTPPNSFRGTPPIGIRRLSTSSLPARPVIKTPVGRKDGGIKFLEITEQPIGFGREAKRRKKLLEGAETEAAKKEKDTAPVLSPTAASTPEYAAGLLPTNISTPQSTASAAPLTSMPAALQSHLTSSPAISASSSTIGLACTTPTSATTSTAETSLSSSTTVPTPTTSSGVLRENVQAVQTTNRIQPTVANPVSQVAVSATNVDASAEKPVPPVAASVSQPTQPTSGGGAHVTVITQPQPQKKGLSLTREQMQEAQEMFRTANKVTRPEKALILGFMAGARDNPCPHLGNVVTIKLSESAENLKQPDGTIIAVVIEMHFQMNYNTGEWKRVRKIRKADE